MAKPNVTLATPGTGKPYRFYSYAITLQPYGWKVIIVYSTDIKSARSHPKFVKLLGKDRDPARISYAFCTSVDSLSVLFLPMASDGRVSSTGTIAHEALHAVKACLERTGVGNNEEAECYLLQYVVDLAYSFGSKVYKFEKEAIQVLTEAQVSATL
jgi:hypothetical protein